MKRERFIELFNDSNTELNIDIEQGVDANNYIKLYLLSEKFSHVWDKIGLPEYRLFGFKMQHAKKNENIYTINLNELYDHIANEHLLLGQDVTLYRIESADNLGIYNAGGKYLFSENSNNNRLDPFYDDKLNTIFNSINDYNINQYKNEWNFAFLKLEDLAKWIHDSETYQNIKNDYRKFNIKEIKVPENMVIIGHDQVIYKKSNIRSIKKLDFNTIENNFITQNLKQKKTTL
jgi:hypothetical protein